MRTLYTSSKCKSFLMIRRTVGNSTLEQISALGIPMLTFEQPLQSHMKPLRRLATFCSASFSAGWAICGSFLPCMSLWIIVISPIWIILTLPYSIGLQWQPGGLAVLAWGSLWCGFLPCRLNQWPSHGPPYMGWHLRLRSPLPGLSWSTHSASG